MFGNQTVVHLINIVVKRTLVLPNPSFKNFIYSLCVSRNYFASIEHCAKIRQIAMKKQYKFYFLAVVFIFIAFKVRGQDSTYADTFNLTNGKWTVCTSVKFSADYKCTNGWTNYNFYGDGTFLEIQKDIKANGTYKFKGVSLFIKRNDISDKESQTTYQGATFDIVWLDKNRFYIKSNDGPEGIVYTYFERIK